MNDPRSYTKNDILARIAKLERRIAVLEGPGAVAMPVRTSNQEFCRPIGNPFTVPKENQA